MASRFAYEWNKYNKIYPEHERHFLKWVYPLKKEDFKNKTVLDAGCGNGRNSFFVLKYGAKSIVAFDCDKKIVDAAKRNLSKFHNAEVIMQSIYKIGYKKKFDIVMCIGVIHHIKYPNIAIRKLRNAVKLGGKLLIWVYGYEGNEWIVKYINPIRKITSKLPLPVVDFMSLFFSVPLYIFLRLPQKKPYFRQLKQFTFRHLHPIVLDQLLPQVSNYYTREEALGLLKNAKIFRVNKNSWALVESK